MKRVTVTFDLDTDDEEEAVEQVQAALAAQQEKPDSPLADYIVQHVE